LLSVPQLLREVSAESCTFFEMISGRVES